MHIVSKLKGRLGSVTIDLESSEGVDGERFATMRTGSGSAIINLS